MSFPSSLRQGLLWLVPCWVLFWGIMLGSRPLATPDEGRYVEIPREMVATGDWVTPRLNGVRYFEKPPLFYWVEAAFLKTFGMNLWAMRWPVALFAILGCALVWMAGCRLWGPRVGFWGSTVLATSPLYFGTGHLIILDMPLSVLVNAALMLFLLQDTARTPRGAAGLRLGAFACAGLAVMTKGLVALALPWGVLGLWALTLEPKKRKKTLARLFCPAGWLVFLIITVPWHVLVSLRNPEFLWFYFVHEHLLRYTTTIHNRSQPVWFFVPVLLLGFAPWSSFLGGFLRARVWWGDERQRLLGLWCVGIFLFFSCSGSKLGPYILPMFPAMALWVGLHIARSLEQRNAPLISGTWIFRGILGLLLPGGLVMAVMRDETFQTPRHLAVLGGMIVLWTAGWVGERWIRDRHGQKAGALLWLAGATAGFLLMVHTVAGDIQKPSTRPLAQVLRARMNPGDAVFCYGHYDQDFPVFMEQTVGVVGWQGELSFGTASEDRVKAWMVSEDRFWALWDQGGGSIFVLLRQKDRAAFLARAAQVRPGGGEVVAETERDVVVWGRPRPGLMEEKQE